MGTGMAVLMGLIEKHVAGDLDCADSDMGSIDAQHNLNLKRYTVHELF